MLAQPAQSLTIPVGEDRRVSGRLLRPERARAAYVLAHGVASLPFEGCIGCGEWLGQMPPRVSLAALLPAVGQDGGDGWHQARVFVAEDGQNRPLQVLQGREERLARGLSQLRQPSTAQCEPRR